MGVDVYGYVYKEGSKYGVGKRGVERRVSGEIRE